MAYTVKVSSQMMKGAREVGEEDGARHTYHSGSKRQTIICHEGIKQSEKKEEEAVLSEP
jgi:hypothetical protein